MEATKFLSSTTLLHPGVSCHFLQSRKSLKKPFVISMAVGRGFKGRDDDYQGRLVDENMIVLRMRIDQEKKLLERSHEPPSNWTGWEKKYYVDYNEDVCEAMGLLENYPYLMDIRPGLALGLIGVAAASVTIFTGIVLFQVLQIAKMIIFYGSHFM